MSLGLVFFNEIAHRNIESNLAPQLDFEGLVLQILQGTLDAASWVD